MTYSEQWVKDNVIIENNKAGLPHHAYILCRNHLAAQSNWIEKHLNPGVVRRYKVDREKGIISFETHVRFIRAIEKAGDNIPRIFILLNQMFTEPTIKLFFKDVWVAHNNVQVRKQNTAERQRIARERKLGLNKPDKVHNECAKLTRGMTIRQAAENYRNF